VNDLARLEVRNRGALCLIRMLGEVDASNAHQLFVAIQDAIPDGTVTVALDLTETLYLDSAGVRLLFALAQRLEVRRQELRLIVPKESPIRTVLELTGLPKVVPLQDHEEGSWPRGGCGGGRPSSIGFGSTLTAHLANTKRTCTKEGSLAWNRLSQLTRWSG
jgi:anti-anti-sigma factor